MKQLTGTVVECNNKFSRKQMSKVSLTYRAFPMPQVMSVVFRHKVCDPSVGTSKSAYNFSGCWIR